MKKENKPYIAKINISHNGNIRIRCYKDIMGKTAHCRNNKKNTEGRKEKKIISDRSKSRTRKKIYEIINNNISDFNSLITLTFKSEIDNYDEAYGYIKNYIRNIRRNLPEGDELLYLIVPEIQEERSKKAEKNIIHFHLLTNIKVGSKLIPEREVKKNKSNIKGKWYGLKYYDLLYWPHGFSSAIEIDNNASGLANYLSKYLSKDDASFFGRRKIITSQNIRRDAVYTISDESELNQWMEDYKDYLKKVYTFVPQKRYMPVYTEYEYQL